MMFTEKNVSLFLIIAKCLLMIHCKPSCVGKRFEMSKEEMRNCLDLHNQLREYVAQGQLRPQPKAANMMEMIWDNELAAMAQRRAARCAESYDRNVSRLAIGQSMFLSKASGRYDNKPDWSSSISNWFKEVKNYHFGNITTSNTKTGQYTQLVWANTNRLGCGYSFYDDPPHGYTKHYVCYYAPGGNVLSESPYQSGQPACDNYGMSRSNRYPGLCYNGSSY